MGDDEGFLREIVDLVRRYGERRFAAGEEAAKKAAIYAFQSAMGIDRPVTPSILGSALAASRDNALRETTAQDRESKREPAKRAPRGIVGRAIRRVLAESVGGADLPEIESRVLMERPDISRKSVGNELRRLEGDLYERDRPRGHRWFLIQKGQEGVGEPAAQAPTSESLPPEERRDATP
jgi:hypothetical protein